ncbi:enolase C-terminal domain-like protein [Rhodococcus sp. NPDC058521]|uniref:enolase C-terminal domain-like protein n=1 Tax=Rhodococcus sp. NPDC058521 TaxID=3346536 RepID=UPI00364E8B34
MTSRTAVTFTLTDSEVRSGSGEVVTSVHANLDEHRIERELLSVAARFGEQPTADATAGVHPAVAAAVWSAVADLRARVCGQTVAAHLGLELPAEVPIAHTVGIDTSEAMASQAAELAARGFSLLKIKLDADATASAQRLTAVVAAAPGAALIVDANEAWTADIAKKVLGDVRGLPVVALEQPLPTEDHRGIRELRSHTDIPLIADESVHTLADLDGLVGLADAVNVKLPKCSGIYQAHALADAARERGLDVMLGCLVSSSLGIAPAVQLASVARWCDLDGHLLLTHDPWSGLGGADGVLRPNRLPGLGVRRIEDEEGR